MAGNVNRIAGVKTLLQFNFKPAGEIFLCEDGSIGFTVSAEEFTEKTEQIYAWVIDDTVVYIGMASKGIRKRLGEHRGGWKGGSKTGLKKAEYIREECRQNRSIMLYGRQCDFFNQSVSVLGVNKDIKVSLISHEEAALIDLFKPEWNVIGK